MADRYWVGGTGNWSDTAHWSATSGGAGGASVPTSADNAIFNAASNTTAYTVTMDATVNCLALNFAAAPSVSGTITLAGSASLNLYGSITLLAGMTNSWTGGLAFSANSGTQVVTSNGIVLTQSITMVGTAGTVQLADNLTLKFLGSRGFSRTSGTFDANGKKVTVKPEGANTSVITGTLTFYDLEVLWGDTGKTQQVSFGSNITVAGTFTVTGNSAVNRILLQSNIIGTARTITAGAVSLTNADFMDITGAGAAAPFTGTSLGDCLGNSGITFTTAATQYWKTTTTGTKTWSTAGNWFLATNGGGGAGRVPLPQDDVVFDASSIGAASTTVSADMPRLGKSITWTGVTNTPTWSLGSGVTSVFGSLTAAAGMAVSGSGATALRGRGSQTITSAGNTWTVQLSFSNPGGTYTLMDALVCTSASAFGTPGSSGGSFNANGFSVTSTAFSWNTGTGFSSTVTMGSGTWTATGSGTVWNILGGGTLTLAPDTSTFKLTDSTATAKTFAGGGSTYNNVWFSGTGTGALVITGSSSFAQIKCDNPLAPVQITAGTTQTVGDWQLSGREILAGFTNYHTDHEGIARSLASGENPVNNHGKRRVCNLVSNSESTTAWSVAGTTPPTTTSTSFTGDTYAGVTFPTGAASYGAANAIVNGSGFTFVSRNYSVVDLAFSLKIALSRPLTGGEAITIYVTGSGGFGPSITLNSSFCPTTPTRVGAVCGFGGALANGSPLVQAIYFHPSGALASPISVYAKYTQAEDVKYQTIRTPGEYVPALSGPAAQYFTTLNGNTLNANSSITEATGAAITAMATQCAKQVVESFNNAQSYAITGSADLKARWMRLQRATAAANGRTYYAGAASTDAGNNTGWTWQNAPATADAAITEGTATLAATGTVAIAAAADVGESTAVLASAATSAIAASATLTESAASLTAAATNAIAATAALSEGPAALDSAATNAIAASADLDEGASSLVFAGVRWDTVADPRYVLRHPPRKFTLS